MNLNINLEKKRKILIKSLVGSHNYNLNDNNSDKDYKVFVCPTYDDLYNNINYRKSFIGEEEDFDIKDVRDLSKLFYKSNINYIEMLFSIESNLNNDLSSETKCKLLDLFKLRNDIAKGNLPYLYQSCMGMHINKKKSMLKPTEGTKHLVKKYGYDTKQFLHSYRVLDFLDRYKIGLENDKDNAFDFAIKYNDDLRESLLELKNGKYTYEQAIKLLDDKEKEVKEMCEKFYKDQAVDLIVFNKVDNIIKDIVKLNLDI